MKKSKILIALSLVFSILFANINTSFAIFGIENKTKSSLVAEMNSEIFFVSDNIEESLPIASISKIMTYFVVRDAIESKKINFEDIITVSKNAASTEGSSIKLTAKEKISIKDLVDGLMIVSGNDSAVALAEAVAGTEEEFVKLMNAKAKEIGLTASTFVNSSGLTEDDESSNKMTAKDIFKMSKAVIEKYPEILDYAQQRVLEQKDRDFKKESTIPLVGTMEGVDGLKTGYTPEAGYCLVSTMKITKGSTEFRLISVLMGAKEKADRAQYTKDMLNYVKANIKTKKIVDKTSYIKRIRTNSSELGYIDAVPAKDVDRITLNNISYTVDLEIGKVKLPLKKGDLVGKLQIKNSEKVVEEVNLVSNGDYKKANIIKRIGRTFSTIVDVFSKIL